MEYLIIYEKGENSYGAYAPDLPGCGVVGDTIEEAAELIDEAIDIHIEGLKKAGEVVPKPTPILSVAPSEFIAMGVKKVNQEKNEHQQRVVVNPQENQPQKSNQSRRGNQQRKKQKKR